MVQGVIARIFEKDFGKGPTYSFTVNGDRTFYRLGPKKPSFKEGDSVRFETKQSGQSTYANGVVPWKEDGATTASPVSQVARSVSGPKTADEFWRNKEQRDVHVQSRIELQSCRNSAIELVRLLLQQGVEAVKLPNAQSKREQIVAEMVSKYTSDFLAENKSGGPSKSGDTVVEEKEAVEAAKPLNIAPAGDNADPDWN